MYIGEIYLEDMLQMNRLEEFYGFYPKEDYEKHFQGIVRLYNEGKYLLLAKTLGVMFEPTLNYLINYGKERPAFLRQLVKDETSDELLAHFAVAMILDTQEDCLIIHGDTQVVENLNYFEFHELDDRDNMRGYYNFLELPEMNKEHVSIAELHETLKSTFTQADPFDHKTILEKVLSSDDYHEIADGVKELKDALQQDKDNKELSEAVHQAFTYQLNKQEKMENY